MDAYKLLRLVSLFIAVYTIVNNTLITYETGKTTVCQRFSVSLSMLYIIVISTKLI